jgi:alkanesulfonate monooxygenase SsuD/methylene tetrahydromethanopterin reductase-like flavin-dependent oxidoreductase (luciferase family)
MTSGIRFGIAALQHLPWQEEVKRWKSLEKLGFDFIMVADHFVNYANPQETWFEAWTLISALASQTEKIRIGAFTAMPFRNPAVLARQAITVDHISDGRLELILGCGAPGSVDPSYKMTGLPDWSSKERVSRFREYVELIDSILSEDVTSYTGTFYSVDGTILNPGPVQKPRPPITVAALGPTMIEIAAKYADTWNSYGDHEWSSPDVMYKNTQKRMEVFEKKCKRIGRDPAEVRKSYLVFGPEGGEVFRSEADFTRIVDKYATLGISEFIFYYPFFDPTQIPVMEKIAQDTLPALRDKFSG